MRSARTGEASGSSAIAGSAAGDSSGSAVRIGSVDVGDGTGSGNTAAGDSGVGVIGSAEVMGADGVSGPPPREIGLAGASRACSGIPSAVRVSGSEEMTSETGFAGSSDGSASSGTGADSVSGRSACESVRAGIGASVSSMASSATACSARVWTGTTENRLNGEFQLTGQQRRNATASQSQ